MKVFYSNIQEKIRGRDLDSMLEFLFPEKKDMFILHLNLLFPIRIVLINSLVLFLMNGKGEKKFFQTMKWFILYEVEI